MSTRIGADGAKKWTRIRFKNPEVAAYMSANFYMVKLDGEGKEPIEFQGKTYKFVPSRQKRISRIRRSIDARAVKLSYHYFFG